MRPPHPHLNTPHSSTLVPVTSRQEDHINDIQLLNARVEGVHEPASVPQGDDLESVDEEGCVWGGRSVGGRGGC